LIINLRFLMMVAKKPDLQNGTVYLMKNNFCTFL